MTKTELDRIKAIRDRNRAAMEAENKAKEAARAEEAAREAYRNSPEAKAAQAQMMVEMVDLVTSPKLGGRPLSSGQLARLKEIRLRNQILATVNALSSKK
jgi:hypothetical protein